MTIIILQCILLIYLEKIHTFILYFTLKMSEMINYYLFAIIGTYKLLLYIVPPTNYNPLYFNSLLTDRYFVLIVSEFR
jgi:hypothetical protein